jgi:excinuclease ABC subunit C
LEQLKEDLRLGRLPVHIECFDNSNMQGSSPVASVVVFKNARPSKKDYRHFNIKTVKGPDDFASMEEIVLRRYRRLLEENRPLPDLILIDGGKGQLNAALKALEKLNLTGNVNIVAIAKKLEEIYYPGDPLPLHISKKSESLKLLQQIRNEAHRFAITFHRKQRTKASLKTTLSDIKGIGKATQKKLLTLFKSEKNIVNASESALIAAIGPRKGKAVFDFFHSNEKSNNTAEQ